MKPEEDVLHFREVIFLNRVLIVSQLVMIMFVPTELLLNGPKLLPMVLSLNVLMLLPLWFHQRRWFVIARYLTLIIG